MKNFIKVIAILICIMLICGLSLSESYLSENGFHVCDDHDCTICAGIHLAINVIFTVTVALTAVALLGFVPSIINLLIVRRFFFLHFDTLIKLKVKLNN